MLNQISMLFGGRIAEEVFMNQMTTGASNDFERATTIARDMVTRYGMTDALGPMVYAENEGEVFLGRSVTKTTNMSEQTMQKVDAEVRRIIDEQYSAGAQAHRRQPGQDARHGQGLARMGNHRQPTSSTTSWPARRRVRRRTGSPRTPPRVAVDPAPVAAAPRSAPLTRRPRRPDQGPLPDGLRGLRAPFGSARLATPLQPAVPHAAMIWQTTRFRVDLHVPAGDGHRQRHAGFVFRRRAARRSTPARWRIAKNCWPTGATCWTSAANPPGRAAPSAAGPRRTGPGAARGARGRALGVPISVDTYKPEVMRAGARSGRRHHQRHLGAAPARRGWRSWPRTRPAASA
jgi:hypothetical protein